MRNKKIPLRMCLGCQEMKPKKELIRIVRKAHDLTVQIDLSGKVSGRGCYICKNIDCFEKAVRSKRLEKSLDCKIPDEVIEQLKEEVIDE